VRWPCNTLPQTCTLHHGEQGQHTAHTAHQQNNNYQENPPKKSPYQTRA